MSRPRLPHLVRETTRHGASKWYFRRYPGPRIRLPGDYGSIEFTAAYEAALADAPVPQKAAGRSGSLQWLYDRYRETRFWTDALSPATRRQRENIFVHVMKTAGHEPISKITSKAIEAGKDRRGHTPAQARNYLDAMRGLFRWAKKADHVKTDPTMGVDNPIKKKGRGFAAWTEADVEAYQKKYPIGTRQRVWLDLLLYTGPRRGDAVKLGKQHLQTLFDPLTKQQVLVIAFRTEKGGEQVEVTIPVLPVLWETLKAGPCGDLAFICGERGQPLVKETFGNMFSAAARAAGIKKSAHGVRKIAATTCANNGASVHQLMSIFGWKTTAMAELYTKEADRRRLSLGGGHTLSRTTEEHSIPAPSHKVRGILPKGK